MAFPRIHLAILPAVLWMAFSIVDAADFIAPDKLACERIPLGELLLTALHQHQRDGNKVLEQTLLFRSKDGGKTWSPPEKLDLLGREQYLTVLENGTLATSYSYRGEDDKSISKSSAGNRRPRDEQWEYLMIGRVRYYA